MPHQHSRYLVEVIELRILSTTNGRHLPGYPGTGSSEFTIVSCSRLIVPILIVIIIVIIVVFPSTRIRTYLLPAYMYQ